MSEIIYVPGNNEIKPLGFRTGNRNIVLEIATRQRTRAKQGFFTYRRYL